MKKKRTPAGAGAWLECAFLLLVTGILAVFGRTAAASGLLRQLARLSGYFAAVLLCAQIFAGFRRRNENRSPKLRTKSKRPRPDLRGVWKVLWQSLRHPRAAAAGRRARKGAAASAEPAQMETQLPQPVEKPMEPAAGADSGKAAEEGAGEELRPEEPAAPLAQAEACEQPDGLAALEKAPPSAPADAVPTEERPRSVRRLDAAYAGVILGVTLLFLYQTLRSLPGWGTESLSLFSYVHVLALTAAAVSCFVLRKFTLLGSANGRFTAAGALMVTGGAAGVLAAATAISVVLKLDTTRAAAAGLALLSLYGAVMILAGLGNAAVRLRLTASFDYPFYLPGIKTAGPKENEAFFDALEANTGISLKSLWSVKYLFRILPGLLLGFLAMLMLSTCLFKLEVYQQAALYRCGALTEQSIYGAGLHLKLPWPIDRVEIYDVARSKQFTIGYENATSGDYLWTQSHGGEEYTLLLGSGNELVSINMRAIYTISDLYRYLTATAEPEQLLAAKGYEIMMHKTVETDLDTLLNVDRLSMADDVAAEMQAFSDEAGLGIKVEAVIVENIHPPIEVSEVYQSVVSSDVRRSTLITNAEARALQTVIQAEEDRSKLLSTAETGQYQRTAEATQQMAVYLAAFEAYDVSPECFLLTKYLDTYEKLIATRKIYVTGDGVDSSRFVLGATGESLPTAVGWSDLEDLMDEQEGKKNTEEEFFYFGWSDDGM